MTTTCTVSRRDFLRRGAAAGALAFLASRWASSTWADTAASVVSNDPVVHFLNRISYGVRPEDLAHAKSIGISAYLEEQLIPDKFRYESSKPLKQALKTLSMTAPKLRKMKKGGQRAYEGLITGGVYLPAANGAQLYERMIEFWSDHFNIASQDLEPEVVDFQRDVIRRHAFGKFRDLLIATAHSPAMLYYLDNFTNVASHPNENYARELMELHTVGVDGGYTETDVKEVARAFTGWTTGDEGYRFDDGEHDTGSKTVLGTTLPSGRGEQDALDVLNLLASHPSTAQFVCRKLCVRFVSDSPPASLVNSLATVWQQTDGDIKAVLRQLFLSAEFAASTGQKLRRPLDFFIGLVRVTRMEFKDFWNFRYQLERLGQVPYGWGPPNGYPDVASEWANTNGLLARWNTALPLPDRALRDKKSGLRVRLPKSIGSAGTFGELVDAGAQEVFGVVLPEPERTMYVDYVSDGAGANAVITPDAFLDKTGTMIGLLLSAPQYQWR